jgi:hypothetical protein
MARKTSQSNIADRKKKDVSARLAAASSGKPAEEAPTKVRPKGTFGAGVPEATAYKMIGLRLAEAFDLI